MRYSSFLGIIALTLTLLDSSTAPAGPITYSIDDYSGLGIQNNILDGVPVHISGFITTDGTTGTGITSAAFIQSWSLSFTKGSDSVSYSSTSFRAQASIGFGGLDVTTASITLHDNGVLVLGGVVDPAYDTTRVTAWRPARYESLTIGPLPSDQKTEWVTNTTQFGFPIFSPIAEVQSVPEPASLSLLAIGVAGMAGYAWRRRKVAAA